MLKPFNLQNWIDEHRELLKPPVGNKVIWKDSEFIVMVVGGPNSRTDYHVNEGEEFFYQLKGTLTLKIVNNEGKLEDLILNGGDVFMLPANVPHSPQRAPESIGLVVERKRKPEEKDGLQWYCQNCGHKLYEEFFHLKDIENQFQAVFDRFNSSKENRTCSVCGTTHP
ncbi:MAG: 3-hydroxyanthranilate 3,4-dioxygenase [Bacteriovoracaceae bacterium]